jgi:hypothetical protein
MHYVMLYVLLHGEVVIERHALPPMSKHTCAAVANKYCSSHANDPTLKGCSCGQGIVIKISSSEAGSAA